MASPPAPQPWQKYTLRAGDTLNEAVFSSWNGQSPLRLPPPADLSVTCSEMTSAIDVRSRTRAMSSSLILPANRHLPRPRHTSCLAAPTIYDSPSRQPPHFLHAVGQRRLA